MRFPPAFSNEIDDAMELEYVGFWLRFWAGVVDCALLMAVLIPVTFTVFGWDYLQTAIHMSGAPDFIVSWGFPAILVFALWTARNETAGKAAISAVVLDERTSAPPTLGQHIGRYLGYFLAVIPFGLGLVWVAFDPKKQGWHDKLAGTIVVRPKKRRRPHALNACK